MLGVLRSLVSADKNRYQEGTHDLDLTYVTERIIAMSFPAEGFESSYRNDINEVVRFLKEKHGDNFMVFNLCSERGYNYALLDNRVQAWCGFPDHHAPPLALVFRVCRSIDVWLAGAPERVVVVHCKAGKGRTGTMIASYLLYCGLFASASLSLDYFALQRSSNMFGVSSPAQRRYVGYAAALIAARDAVPQSPRLILARVVLRHLPPLDMLAGQLDTELRVEVCNVTQGKRRVHASLGALDGGVTSCVFSVNAIVQGDVQIDVTCSKLGLLGGKRDHKFCFVQFHTAMLPPLQDAGGATPVVFGKAECDKVAYDKRFAAAFELVTYMEPVRAGSPYHSLGEEDMRENLAGALARADQGAVIFYPCATDEDMARKIREARGATSSVRRRAIEKAGYLCKMGLTVRSWQDRWFILRDGNLSYYKTPKHVTPSGVIPLESVWTVTLMRDKTVEASQPYRHALVIRTPERDFVLCSNDVLGLEEWHDALLARLQQQP